MRHLPVKAGAFLVFLLFSLSAFGAAKTKKNSLTWQAALPWPSDSFEHKRFQKFATAIEKAMGNRIQIEEQTAGVHDFPIDRLYGASRAGLVPVSEWVLTQAEQSDPIFSAGELAMPVNSWHEAQKRYKTLRPLIEAALARQGLRLLAITPWGPPGLFSKSRPSSAKVGKSLKVKVYNQTGAAFVEHLGGEAVPMGFHELADGFRNKEVNAVLTAPTTGLLAKLDQRTSYFTDLMAMQPVNVIVVGRVHFDRLSPKDQEQVLKAAMAVEQSLWDMTEDRYLAAKRALAARGVKVLETPPAWLTTASLTATEESQQEWSASLSQEQRALLREAH